MISTRVLASLSLASMILGLSARGSLAWGQESTSAPIPSATQDAAAATPPVPMVVPPLAELGSFPVDPAMEAITRERLSRAFAQRARNLLQREAVYLGVLDAAKMLFEEAVELNPDNPNIWRLVLDLATAMREGESEAGHLEMRALKRLNELEPRDEIVLLRRLLHRIDDRQTAEERLAISEKLLAPESVARIGHAVAARIAFDRAILLERTGDRAGYERELLRALDLDGSFPQAAEVAAGYFGTTAPGPAEQAQALRAAVTANPSRDSVALALANLCMSYGAYNAACEILNVQTSFRATQLPSDSYDTVLADFVIALWGADQTEIAAALIRTRQKQLNSFYVAELERRGVNVTMERRRQLSLPFSESLLINATAMIAAVNTEGLVQEIQGVAGAFKFRLELLELRETPPLEVAQVMLEAAMVQLWFAGDVDAAVEWIDEANTIAPISAEARARFDGWISIRKGEVAAGRAQLLLQPADDAMASIGVATADELLGDKKGAAQRFLAIARNGPATATGLWARSRLRVLLGNDVSVMKESAAVEAAAALPPAFLELMKLGANSMMMRVQPRLREVSPFDPMIFDIELINRSDWPLAISAEGPIKDTMTVTATVNVPRRVASQPPFAFVAVDRIFSIPPRGSLQIALDVSLTDASILLREDPLAGAFLSVHAISNWRTTNSGVEPGPMGLETESPEIHITGVRMTAAWVESELAALADTTRPVNPETVAMLAHAVARASKLPELVDASVHDALVPAGAVLADAAARVTPQTRAWLLFACPKPRRPDEAILAQEMVNAAAGIAVEAMPAVPELAMMEAVFKSDATTLTRMAWISTRAKRPEDPRLAEAMLSLDPKIAAFAKAFHGWMSDTVEAQREKLNLTK